MPQKSPQGPVLLWQTLSSLRVFEDGQVDKKGRFNYLKWQAAWRLFREHFPDSGCTFETYTNSSGSVSDVMYYMDGSGSVTGTLWAVVDGNRVEITHSYPILNHQNKAIKSPNAFDINTSRMRCKVKCAALMGLGLHIYEGAEDDSSLLSNDTGDDPEVVKEEKKQVRKPKRQTLTPVTGEGQAAVDLFVDEMINLGVNIEKVQKYVKGERKLKLGELSPGDLMGLKDYVINTIDSGFWS